MTNSQILSLSQLNGVDLIKFVMAFAVIAIHIQPACGEDFPDIVEWFIRLAVPFYFIASGFLMARKLAILENIRERIELLRFRSIQVFRLFAIWLVIYFPISIGYSISEGYPIALIVKKMAIDIVVRGEINMAWPLWFLYSLGIYTLALSWSIHSKKRMILITVISFISIYLQYMLNTVNILGLTHLEGILINILPTRVLSGGGYIITGYMLFNYIERHDIYIFMIGSFLLSIALFYLGLPFSALFGGFSLFLMAYNLPLYGHTAIFRRLRVQSMWIYYIHMYIVVGVIGITKANGINPQLWIMFMDISMIAIGISATFCYLQNIPNFKFLKSLIK